MTPAPPRPVSPPGTTDDPVAPEDVLDYPRPADGLPALTASRAALQEAARRLSAGTGPVAVDAERASGFRYGQEAYLVQLRRTGSGTVLVDPAALGAVPATSAGSGGSAASGGSAGATPLDALAGALDGTEWILHAADQDLPCLGAIGLRPARLFDTEIAARLLGRTRVGLAAVVEETLGLRLAKDHAAADWSTRPLPESWLVYAALDVELLIPLRAALAEELEHAGKADWADQEFEYVRTRPERPARLDPWRRTPRAGRAVRSPRSLAILRELWTQREELAQELDRTPSKVLPHQALIAAAVTRPTSRRQLSGLREFSSRLAREHHELWWRAVQRGLELPEDELPPTRAPLAPGELPQPRSWARHHPEAARYLDLVRTAVRERADELTVPQELLLAPDTQRHLAWELGEELARTGAADRSPAALARRLVVLEARPWQVEQATTAIADALA